MERPVNFLNVGTWNIHGLFTYVNKVKLCKLSDPEFQKRLRTFDVLALQEIQCGPNEIDARFTHGFRAMPFFRKKSKNNRFFGGTLLLVKNEIRNGIKVIDNLNGDKVWSKISKEFFNFERDLFLCFAYISPPNSPYANSLNYDIFQKIEEDISRYTEQGNIILAGDMNAKTGVMRDIDLHPIDSQGKRFLKLCKIHKFEFSTVE